MGDYTEEFAGLLGHEHDTVLLGCGRLAGPGPQAADDLGDLGQVWLGGVTQIEPFERLCIGGSRRAQDHLWRVTVGFAVPRGCQRSPFGAGLVRR